MKRTLQLFCVATVAVATGCSTAVRVTNQDQPGPKAGNVVGAGVGYVGGNVAGAAVGVVEGTAATAGSAFDPQTRRIVRYWKTETTPDGRTIQVPVEYEVDEYGRVIREVK